MWGDWARWRREIAHLRELVAVELAAREQMARQRADQIEHRLGEIERRLTALEHNGHAGGLSSGRMMILAGVGAVTLVLLVATGVISKLL